MNKVDAKPNLFLIGYRGSGKSTLAPGVATKLGFDWLDTDRMVEEQLGEPIWQYFARCGEARFRQIETQVVDRVARLSGYVISLGGGAVLAPANRESIRRSGKVVWLRCSVETLASRLARDQSSNSQRPSLTGGGVVQEIREVLLIREPIYRASADWILDADQMDPEALSERIVGWWKSVSIGGS